MEPTSHRQRGEISGRRFFSHAMERLRILGEIPVRKFENGEQPLDPDGNPDTSFLAKIPADTAFTFQTIDRHGLLLNASQTWHQLRPGEIRHDCGGCHAHSQEPTRFADTLAARPEYPVWDLTSVKPLITAKGAGEEKRQWDAEDASGVRRENTAAVDVEYYRHIQPLLQKHCVACHSSEGGRAPAGNLDLAADDEVIDIPHKAKLPGTYYRIAADERAQFGHKPVGYDSWGYPNASRYIRKFQARRSLLVWKLFGERLDGFTNDDHPSESKPGSGELTQRGEAVDLQKFRARWDLDFSGSIMPPPKAVADGKVPPLSEEDRRTVLRWIDLGCPIDLDYNPETPEATGYGWLLDDNRPVLTLAEPSAGGHESLHRIVLGMYDYGSGIDPESVRIEADFEVNGREAGEDLHDLFQIREEGIWDLTLEKPVRDLGEAVLRAEVRDLQGNTTRVERTFRVGK